MFPRYGFVYQSGLRRVQGTRHGTRYVFTICLFISPDLDGHRAPKNESFTGLQISMLMMMNFMYTLDTLRMFTIFWEKRPIAMSL
jgi:hypothetical protein